MDKMLLNITFERIIYRKKSVIHTHMCIKKDEEDGGYDIITYHVSLDYVCLLITM
jgi:hypothetical protein